MRIVRFYFEPWQRGGSEISSPSSASSLPFLSVQRRQRMPSFDDLSSIDTALFEKKSSHFGQSNTRKIPQMVKRLSVLCSDVIASNVRYTRSIYLIAHFLQYNFNSFAQNNIFFCSFVLFHKRSHKRSHWVRAKVICGHAKISAPAVSTT